MSAFRPIPRGRRRIAARAVVRTTIALLVLTIGVTAGPFSFAHSRSVDPSRQEIGSPPEQFAFWRGGQADIAHWVVVGDSMGPGGTAIERSDTDRSVHNALAVYMAVSARNARIRTHFKLIAGSSPSAGLALRVTGPDDYYLVRASEDEQRVSLLRVVGEASEEIAGADADITRDHWQTLEVTARDNEFSIWLDDQWVLTVFDDGKLSAGQFGIWTERDGATRFNQVEISPLPTGYELDLQRRSGGRGNRSGMIEDRRAKGVHPRDWALDATGKAVFSDLRNSFIDLVKSHLALRLVTDTARPTPALILLPLAVVSSWAGVRLVQMIDVRNFNTAITIILLGVSLILVCQGVARFREL